MGEALVAYGIIASGEVEASVDAITPIMWPSLNTKS